MIETDDENTRKLRSFSRKHWQQLILNYVLYLFDFPLEGRLRQGLWFCELLVDASIANTSQLINIGQGHPTTNFGKYLFGRRFEI